MLLIKPVMKGPLVYSFLEGRGAVAEQPLFYNHSHHSRIHAAVMRPDRTERREGPP